MRRVRVSDAELTFDPSKPERFRCGVARLGALLGAELTGTSIYEVPPGRTLFPYHYEYGEEEWMMALDGRPTVRTPEGTDTVEPFEIVFFPRGPEGAHQVRNDTDAPIRVLMWSNVVLPTATAYPDSDKVGVWTGDDAEDLMVHRSAGVDYFSGETTAPGSPT